MIKLLETENGIIRISMQLKISLSYSVNKQSLPLREQH